MAVERILLEDGVSFLLLESGDKFLTETSDQPTDEVVADIGGALAFKVLERKSKPPKPPKPPKPDKPNKPNDPNPPTPPRQEEDIELMLLTLSLDPWCKFILGFNPEEGCQ